MSHVAFIGLGIMGRPMAANLVAAGHVVRGYSRGETSRRRAEESGVPTAKTLTAALDGADVVVLVLPDTPDVVDVLEGHVLHSLASGGTVIDMSTIEPGRTRDLHAACAERGLAMLDAPVSGGEAGAVEGSLSIMVGGDAEVLTAQRPLLEAMGRTIVHVGGPGAGQVVKAANQLMVAGHLQMLAEALAFLDAHGVDPVAALDVIGAGLAGSTVIQRKRDSVLAGNFEPGFRLALHHKDLGIVSRAAREEGVALPATALVAQLVQAMIARGDGGLDHSALVLLARTMNGRHADVDR